MREVIGIMPAHLTDTTMDIARGVAGLLQDEATAVLVPPVTKLEDQEGTRLNRDATKLEARTLSNWLLSQDVDKLVLLNPWTKIAQVAGYIVGGVEHSVGRTPLSTARYCQDAGVEVYLTHAAPARRGAGAPSSETNRRVGVIAGYRLHGLLDPVELGCTDLRFDYWENQLPDSDPTSSSPADSVGYWFGPAAMGLIKANVKRNGAQ